MTDIERRIADLKARLDTLRAEGRGDVGIDLQRANDIELTYASNAIEGNTLTHGETAELIEHGITAGGKALKDHQEIVDHYAALQWMREQVAARTPVNEALVIELHRRALETSRPDIAGTYVRFGRRIAGSGVVLPNPAKVPVLMEKFGTDLAAAPAGPLSAFDAHYRLVTIHPFDDGNGRTARLLTNMMLLRDGYVPVSVRPEDRRQYLDTLRDAQLAQDDTAPAFQAFMLRRLEAALERHIDDVSAGAGADHDHDRPSAARLAAMAAQRGQGL